MIGQSVISINFQLRINQADYYTLLRIPGIGVISAKRIILARRSATLKFEHLKKLGVVLKRARFFITCNGKYFDHVNKFNQGFIQENLILLEQFSNSSSSSFEQLSLFDCKEEYKKLEIDSTSFGKIKNNLLPTKEDKIKCLTGSL